MNTLREALSQSQKMAGLEGNLELSEPKAHNVSSTAPNIVVVDSTKKKSKLKISLVFRFFQDVSVSYTIFPSIMRHLLFLTLLFYMFELQHLHRFLIILTH